MKKILAGLSLVTVSMSALISAAPAIAHRSEVETNDLASLSTTASNHGGVREDRRVTGAVSGNTQVQTHGGRGNGRGGQNAQTITKLATVSGLVLKKFSDNSFLLLGSAGKRNITVVLDANTIVTNRRNNPSSRLTISPNHSVTVTGVQNGLTITARSVKNNSLPTFGD